MLINIQDADKDGKRPIVVMDGDTEIFSAVAADLAGAHRIVKAGVKHGWDSDEANPAKPKPAK